MAIKATIAGEVSLDFPIKIGWNDAERLIVNNKVDEYKLRAYILTKELGNDYPVLQTGENELSSLNSYLEEKEANNDYSFIGCNGCESYEDGYLFYLALCYNYGTSAEVADNATAENVIDRMQTEAIYFALAFKDFFDNPYHNAQVNCATIKINGVEREFYDEDDIRKSFDAFVADAKNKSREDNYQER